MTTSTVKFAVIGCGHIGKRHAEMIKRNPEAELVAICDILPADKVNTAQFGVPHYTTLVDMFEAHPEIEVVNIATPNGFHCKQALQALDARKHVVIEKPLALS
jgi:predicted dehydrogenase